MRARDNHNNLCAESTSQKKRPEIQKILDSTH